MRSISCLFLILCVAAGAQAKQVDLCSFMHGIEAVEIASGHYLVFFSSSGLPPTGALKSGNWPHDVYVADWKNTDGALSPKLFIQKPEAQEPVSVALSTDGHIMVSFEDGWNTKNGVNQRYGVYDTNLNPVKPYPNNVEVGAHSGHTAAVGNVFVVFYSDDWVNGGGVDNLGTSKGVYAKIYNSKGKLLHDVDIAPDVREWWPMIAGSPTQALLLWQQFVPKQTYANLKIAVLDPNTGEVAGERVLQEQIQYYTYKTAYVPALDAFLVTATSTSGHGSAYLIDESGNTLATLSCMPATVREAGITVNGTSAYTPSADGRLLTLALSASSITFQGVQPSPIAWSYTGSVGLIRDAFALHWVSLSQSGLLEADFDLHAATTPSAADRCQ